MAGGPRKANTERKVTRYTYDDVKEPRTPETGHTALLPGDEQVVTLPMDNGWSKAIEVGKLPKGDDRPVMVDMDPATDPVLFWAGKRNRREVAVLPLQRNEIVSESRISQIVERAVKAAAERSGTSQQQHFFAELEKALRESDRAKRVEFYTHEEGWKNKLICGDSLHAMASLLHHENMRGKVQMIYVDPPYGIKYDSNFQQRIDAIRNEDEDAGDDVLTIKAFRDTWALGVHSYLSYLSDRLFLCRELLARTGSIFVQTNDENVHLVRTLLDEVFGHDNFTALIPFTKTAGQSSNLLPSLCDYLVWYAKDLTCVKYNPLFLDKLPGGSGATKYTSLLLPDGTTRPATPDERNGAKDLPKGARLFRVDNLKSQGYRTGTTVAFEFRGRRFHPGEDSHWKCTPEGLERLANLGRLIVEGNNLAYVRFIDDFPAVQVGNAWMDVGGIQSRSDPKVFVVQTSATVVSRAIALTTDPGDLTFDPTCGSGTTALCAEKLGRRWITCDTSRVAINVARKRLLSALFEHYKTRDGHISSKFIYKSINRITLRSLAYDLEPEKIELIDQPETDENAVRVAGPFDVLSLGRYSVEDWKGYVVRDSGTDAAKLENYIEVVCRLYRKNAAIQGAAGIVHAVAEAENEKIAISVGPLSGRVTAKQINDAVQDALASGILEVHVLGWAFEANVGEVKSQLERRGKVRVELIMIRPDTLAEGLKAMQPEMLFSPLALPDIEVANNGEEEPKLSVTLKGVALFDRKQRTTEYKRADSGYVSAWYLDEDYDGDCFVDCQMFFDFKKTPNIRAALKAEVSPEEFTLKLVSEPFPVRGYKRIAVKLVDVFGNESTVVRDLS